MRRPSHQSLTAPFRDRPRVGLIGFYGWGNYGDELFLDQWRRVLRPYADADQVHDLLQVPYLSEDPDEVVQRYDAFVIGGGDLVLPYAVSQLYWKRAWLERPVFIVGVGVALWRRRHVPEVIEEMSAFFRHPNVQYISARDEVSAAWIREHLRPRLPVHVHPDLAFAAELPTPVRAGPKPVLGVSVRHERGISTTDFTALAPLVEAARADGYRIDALVLGHGRQFTRDRPVLEHLPFTPDRILAPPDTCGMSAAIGGLDAFACVKYHGLLVAARYGVPVLALAPNLKNTSLAGQLGRDEMVVDVHDAGDLTWAWEALRRPIRREAGGEVGTETVRALEQEAQEALDAVVARVRRVVRGRRRRCGLRDGARRRVRPGLGRGSD